MFVHAGPCGRSGRHRGQDMCWFDPTAFDLRHIQRVNAIDEGTIPFVFRIKIRTEAPVDKDIDDISKSNEQLKMELLD